MKSVTRIAFALLALVLVVGCASTKVTESESYIGNEKLPRPERIYVYPFVAAPEDIPDWSASAEQYDPPNQPPTAEELKAGRELGALVAKELVEEIDKMGLPVLKGDSQSRPQPNDMLIIGYFEAVEEGGTGKRLVVGFGAGNAEVSTEVEGYQMTEAGPRLLGSRELEAGGGKTPGLIVPVALFAATNNPIGLIVMGSAKVAGEVTGSSKVEGAAKRTAKEIGEQLEVKFKEQGWIK